MKRILCILSSLGAGGAETFLMKISRVLPQEDYRMDFIISEPGGCYTREVLERGGRIHTIPMRTKNLRGAFRGIRRVVRDNNYDCVLKLGETSIAAVDLIAARLGGAKHLAMRSCNAGVIASKPMRLLHLVLRPVLNLFADVKLAPSMLAAEFTFGKHCAHRNVQLLHNGVDLEVFRFDPQWRAEIRREFDLGDRLIVGHVGRFHEQKNHPFLLKVFACIREQRPDAVLVLVGTGKLQMQIEERVAALGMQDSVIFTGRRFDIPKLLSAMDVFVFPSFFEGMPNTIIEAQATGLPCVLADTITPEADITGLLTYLPLTASAEVWAQGALAAVRAERPDTRSAFRQQGYDIRDVAKRFYELVCPDGSGETEEEMTHVT